MPQFHPESIASEFDPNSSNCRGEVEKVFSSILEELGQKGFHRAEVAMILADTAEEFIMAYPAGRSHRH